MVCDQGLVFFSPQRQKTNILSPLRPGSPVTCQFGINSFIEWEIHSSRNITVNIIKINSVTFLKKDYKIEFIEFHTRCTYKISTEYHFNRRCEHRSELPMDFAKEMTMLESGGTITE